jgi:hypothetical protein
MRIIRVQPSQRFPRYWEAAEGDRPQPAFRDRNDAITYAKGRRFGQSRTEIHVYDYDGKEIVEKNHHEWAIKVCSEPCRS